MLSTPLIIMLMISFISAQIPSQVSFVFSFTVSQTPVIASFMAVNFSSTAVLIVSHRFDTKSLMDSHISDVLLLTFSQAVLIDALIALNNVPARDLILFHKPSINDLIAFHTADVFVCIVIHALDTHSTMPFQTSCQLTLRFSVRKVIIPVSTLIASATNSVIAPITKERISIAALNAPTIYGASISMNHSAKGLSLVSQASIILAIATCTNLETASIIPSKATANPANGPFLNACIASPAFCSAGTNHALKASRMRPTASDIMVVMKPKTGLITPLYKSLIF